LRRQDALHRAPGESAVTDGALECARQILAVVCGKQAQHACGFIFATAPGADQFVEEQDSLRSELRKTLFQQLVFLVVIAPGRMLGKTALLSADSRRVQFMAGDLLHVGAVDDQFLLGDAYRQQFSNALPRHGVEVLKVRHMTFRIHRPVEGLGGVVSSRR
jgi:hypothetical protein